MKDETVERITAEVASVKYKFPVEIAVSFVSPEEIKKLNSEYRNIDSDTDVLSFSLREGEFGEISGNVLGDVVICPEVVAGNASENGISENEELVRVLVHGVLHLVGYDHATPDEETEMFGIQEEFVKKFMREGVKI